MDYILLANLYLFNAKQHILGFCPYKHMQLYSNLLVNCIGIYYSDKILLWYFHFSPHNC